MDCIWKTLPNELSEKICNTLIKVRKIDGALKREIEQEQWKLNKFYWDWTRHLAFIPGWMPSQGWVHVYIALVNWLKGTSAKLHVCSQFKDELICREIWALLSPENRDDFLRDVYKDNS